MSNKEKIIEGSQAIVTNLSQQADGHAIQARIFASKGFSKLADKYNEHAQEERGYVVKCIDRILDLGSQVKLEEKSASPVYENPIEWIKYDLQISKNGLAWLYEIVEEAKDDFKTFDILKEYYEDEEEDMYWGEQQLELIECIGEKNWILQQI